VLAEETAQLSRELGVPISSDLVERAYVSRILPRKLAMDAQYLRTRSVGQDVRLLVLTIFRVLRPSS
jgi:lipopolysaccharide/colanic/teichoic acid biosynthesis glycosyltransferase